MYFAGKLVYLIVRPSNQLAVNYARVLNYRFINFLFPLELYGQDL